MPTFDFTTASLPTNVTLTRASSGTRINSSGTLVSETTNVARYTYNPATLAIRGLLNEPQRTNLLLRSQQFNTAPNNLLAITVNETSVAAPDSTTTGNKFTETSASGGHEDYQQVTQSANTVLAMSCYYEASSRSASLLNLSADATTHWATAIFDLSGIAATQTAVGAGSGTIVSTGISNAGSSWRRAFMVASISQANPYCNTGLSNGTTGMTFGGFGEPQYNGDGSSFAYAWGAQMEAASDVSSYIPTTSATVTRSADVLTISSTGIPNGTYDITIVRESGTIDLGLQAVSGGYVVPTDVSPLQTVIFTPVIATAYKPQSHGPARHNFRLRR